MTGYLKFDKQFKIRYLDLRKETHCCSQANTFGSWLSRTSLYWGSFIKIHQFWGEWLCENSWYFN